MTPRQWKCQLDIHKEVEKAKYGSKDPVMKCIDQIPGW